MDIDTTTGEPASAIERVLARNRAFLGGGGTEKRPASGRPALGLAIVTCMDARLTRLLPDALGLSDGDAAIIQVAGATLVEPYGEAMRSLLVAVGELGVRDIMVIGHTDCGTCGMRAEHLLDALEGSGTERERIDAVLSSDPRAGHILDGFTVLEDEVASSVRAIRAHPLMPRGIRVSGFTIDIETGRLTEVAV